LSKLKLKKLAELLKLLMISLQKDII